MQNKPAENNMELQKGEIKERGIHVRESIFQKYRIRMKSYKYIGLRPLNNFLYPFFMEIWQEKLVHFSC
jgi:hypothetical protein